MTKYGGYVLLTLELIDRNDSLNLLLCPRELAKDGICRVSGFVAAVFTDNFAEMPNTIAFPLILGFVIKTKPTSGELVDLV